jgi:hypothetical protein
MGECLDLDKMNASDVADMFRIEAPAFEHVEQCYVVLPVLPFLVGKPWNNNALNYVYTLRPSLIQVVSSSSYCTCDYFPWRVWVFLEGDDRTIRKIEQEVIAAAYGIRYGADLKLHNENSDTPYLPDGESLCIVNTRGLKNLTLSTK